MSTLPKKAKFVIIGAGIHGLSTAWNIGEKLKAKGHTVKENDIVLFPSKTLHSTEPNKSNNERISISGDITFLSKDSSLLEHLTPSFENWNKL